MSIYAKSEEISGVIENVVYRNENNDYTVMEIADADNNIIVAVGVIPMACEGERVVLRGAYTFHKEFGRQFAFDAFEKALPEEVDDILHYLSSRAVKGIGPVTALKIVNRFGKDSFDVIENHPEWLSDIPGITMKKAAVISESFREQSGMRGVVMFCKDYMDVGEAARVYKRLGGGATGILNDNPYVLCEEEIGIPFEKVDAMAKALGCKPDSEIRIFYGLKHTLAQSATNNGHTCLPRQMLIDVSSELLGLDTEIVSATLELLIKEGELSAMRCRNEIYVMTKETDEAENFIAKRLFAISNDIAMLSTEDIGALIEKVECELNINFAPLQREALFDSLQCGTMILTGGPGTGKTTVIRAMISMFRAVGEKVVLAAPTGRAAKRMSEATSEEAKTIHRMLEMERTAEGDFRFGRNERAPISEGVVIVDEASMIDLSLMSALVRALRRGARLILIGDADQLPSVGAGNVFYDLISSERIKTVRLTEIFRQSKESLIVTNAHKINRGEAPILNKTDKDFFFVRRESERDIPDTVASLILERLPRAYGSDIKEQIQVITPSRKGMGGVENLNATLQDRINPPAKFKKEKHSHGTLFREGDRVMQIVNDYDIEWEKNGVLGVGLFNGDIGNILSINPRTESMTVCFDDRTVEYPFEKLDELELSYAITVHKSQGSEYPVVVIPMYYCPPMLMTRNLLYTAVTRAKKMVVLVGRSDVPEKMAKNCTEILRYTTLKDKILNYY